MACRAIIPFSSACRPLPVHGEAPAIGQMLPFDSTTGISGQITVFRTVSGRGALTPAWCAHTRTGSSPSIFSVAWSTAFGLGSITRLGYLQCGRTCRRQPNTLKWSSAIARPGGFWVLLRGSSCRGSRLTGSEGPGLR